MAYFYLFNANDKKIHLNIMAINFFLYQIFDFFCLHWKFHSSENAEENYRKLFSTIANWILTKELMSVNFLSLSIFKQIIFLHKIQMNANQVLLKIIVWSISIILVFNKLFIVETNDICHYRVFKHIKKLKCCTYHRLPYMLLNTK